MSAVLLDPQLPPACNVSTTYLLLSVQRVIRYVVLMYSLLFTVNLRETSLRESEEKLRRLQQTSDGKVDKSVIISPFYIILCYMETL